MRCSELEKSVLLTGNIAQQTMFNLAAFTECYCDAPKPHPVIIGEPINLSLARPIENLYELQAPPSASLSTMQESTIALICGTLLARGAFLLGDSTGVGKGRTIAGVLRELTAVDPTVRAIWISSSLKLESEAASELNTLGLRGEPGNRILFTSYNCLSRNYDRALAHGAAILIFDECHMMRNISKTSEAALRLANDANAKILCASATPASCPRHLQYIATLLSLDEMLSMSSAESFQQSLKLHRNSIMELIALTLKMNGMYVSRQILFCGVEVERVQVSLSQRQRVEYDMLANNFIGKHVGLRSFQRKITSFKTATAIQLIEHCIQNGESVILSLTNTYEQSTCAFANTAAADHVVEQHLENPLNDIIDKFGEENVAELTGRKSRFVKGLIRRKPDMRSEINAFQTDTKHIAILSRAGGLGISLHTMPGRRRRVHIVLELPWSVEDFVQQLGRSFRSSSTIPPRYVFLTTDIPGEMRYEVMMSLKLRSLGALVRGDRKSCNANADELIWNAPMRRMFATCIGFATHYDESVRCPMSKAAVTAWHVLNRNQHKDVEFELLKRLDVEKCNEASLSAATVAKMLPHYVVPMFTKWSPATHAQFPYTVKRRIVSLFCCAQHCDAENTLGKLPESILLMIAECMAKSTPLNDMRRVGQLFRTRRVSLASLLTLPIESLLNHILHFDIYSQNVVCNFLKERRPCVLDRRERGAIDLVEYVNQSVKHRVGGGVLVSISSIASAYDAIIVTICCNVLEGEPALLRKCISVDKIYVIATNNLLNQWPASKKVILRIPPCDKLPTGAIGILLKTL